MRESVPQSRCYWEKSVCVYSENTGEISVNQLRGCSMEQPSCKRSELVELNNGGRRGIYYRNKFLSRKACDITYVGREGCRVKISSCPRKIF